MRFGAAIWLGLLALPVALLVLDLLWRHERTVAVSSLALWQEQSQRVGIVGGVARWRADPAILTVCAAIAALALGAADPWWVFGPRSGAVAVVVDCSTSMLTREDPQGPSRFALAQQAGRALLDRFSHAPHRFLLLAGGTTQSVAGGPDETRFLRDALDGAVVDGDGSGFGAAFATAVDLVREARGGIVHVISDFAGEPPDAIDVDPGVAIEWIAVGRPAENIGLGDVVTSAVGASEGVVTVVNASRGRQTVAIRAARQGAEPRSATLALEPGESRVWSFPIDPETQRVEVSIEPGGALAADDLRVWRRPPAIELVADDIELGPSLRAAVDALVGRGLAAAGTSTAVHLRRSAGEPALPGIWIGLPESGADDSARPFVAVDVVDSRADFLQRFYPILVDPTAITGSAPAASEPLALVAGRPVLALVEGPGSRGVWWGVPTEATDLGVRGLLPLVLLEVARLAAGPPADVTGRADSADLTPHPPPSSIAAEDVVRSGLPPSRRVRRVLLALAAALLVVEALRRAILRQKHRAVGSAALLRAPSAVVLLLLLGASIEPSCTARRSGKLAVLVDVSASMPVAELGSALAGVARALKDGERRPVAVYTFDAEPRLVGSGDADRAADLLGSLTRRGGAAHGTDPGRAIRQATDLVAAAGQGALLLVTDGQDTRGDGTAAARAAAAAGVVVHVLPVKRRSADVVLESLQLPERVRAGEIYEALAVVRSTVEQDVEVTIESSGQASALRRARVGPGEARAFNFLLQAGPTSTTLLATLTAEQDSDTRDNLARTSLVVEGAPRMAAVGHDPGRLSGVEILEAWPDEWALRDVDALLLRLSPDLIPPEAWQDRVAAWAEAGRGLLVICDDVQTAMRLRGGPLERILPARLEAPRGHDEDTALVLLIDRSGSMDRGSVSGTAMASALAAAESVAALLDETDRYGVIAFDVAHHVLRPLGSAHRGRSPVTGSDGTLHAAGGTDWASSLDLAAHWLASDPAKRRHVILISDGNLAPGASGEPRAPWPAGVTLSTVSVGASGDSTVLGLLAARHGGRHHRVSRSADLPATLRVETAGLRPPVERHGPLHGVPTENYADLLPEARVRRGARAIVIDPRPAADLALRGKSGDALLLFGQAGWGRTALLVAGPESLEGSSDVTRLLTGALRRVASGTEAQGGAMHARFDGATLRLRAVVERGGPTPVGRLRLPSGETVTLPIRWTAPGMIETDYRISQVGEYLVELGGQRRRLWQTRSAEVVLPTGDDGAGRLARAGGGTLLGADGGTVRRLPRVPRMASTRDATPWFTGLAALLLFMDAALGVVRPGAMGRASGGRSDTTVSETNTCYAQLDVTGISRSHL